jgi:hypothetical protein
VVRDGRRLGPSEIARGGDGRIPFFLSCPSSLFVLCALCAFVVQRALQHAASWPRFPRSLFLCDNAPCKPPHPPPPLLNARATRHRAPPMRPSRSRVHPLGRSGTCCLSPGRFRCRAGSPLRAVPGQVSIEQAQQCAPCGSTRSR